MLKCLFIKRKLYDYSDNTLSDIDTIKVKRHLEICSGCRVRLEEIKNVINLASAKEPPRPSEDFWRNFNIDLNRKLDRRAARPIRIELGFRYRLRPVFAYAMIIIFFIGIGGYFFKKGHNSLGQNRYLVEEVMALEDIGEEIDV